MTGKKGVSGLVHAELDQEFLGLFVVSFLNNEYIDANCDVAVLPKAEDGTRKSIYNGLGWAASAQGGEAVLQGSALMYGGIKLPVVCGDQQGFCFLLEQVERKE